MMLSSTPTNVSLVSMNWTFWDTTSTAKSASRSLVSPTTTSTPTTSFYWPSELLSPFSTTPRWTHIAPPLIALWQRQISTSHLDWRRSSCLQYYLSCLSQSFTTCLPFTQRPYLPDDRCIWHCSWCRPPATHQWYMASHLLFPQADSCGNKIQHVRLRTPCCAKHFTVNINGRHNTISIDCLKPAHIKTSTNITEHSTEQSIHTSHSPTTPTHSPITPRSTRSGCLVRFPSTYLIPCEKLGLSYVVNIKNHFLL